MFSFYRKTRKKSTIKKLFTYSITVLVLLVFIGLLTTVQPAYRISSDAISSWTDDIDASIFLNLIGLENRVLMEFYQEENQFDTLPETVFQLLTSIRPNDFRSLLGNELPGFSIYNQDILIAGEGTDYTNLPVESSFPLEDILEEREALLEDDDEEELLESDEKGMDDSLESTVFLYNTHNRESYLPHLPDIEDADAAHHDEVNVTLVSERLENELASQGIGSITDKTDIVGEVLVEKDWEYWQSYRASREVVTEAFSQEEDLKYAFDIHRDSIERSHTTKEINGEDYARIMFVIGEDNPAFESNYQLAKKLHEGIEERYPGLSRGVVPQGGSGLDGVYNQDLSENVLLLEVGGVENTLEESYRSVEVFAEVFSEYYWDAEAVGGN